MKQNFLYLMGGMLWAAFQSLSAQPVSWTDDSLQPDTVWFTNNKSEKEYILSRPEELAGLSVLVNSYGYTFQGKTIRLAKDISLKRVIAEEAVCWEPVGDYIRNSKEVYFQGVFDGQGHTIDGMRVIGSHSCSGFFGALKGATVRDVVIGSQSVITTEKTISYIGALAGRVEESRLTGCINKASLSALKEQNIQLGGLVGSLGGESYVENCKNYGNVSAGGYVGGICGVMSTDTIVNCTNLGQLSEAYYDLGGIVGYANGDYRLVNNLNVGLIAGGGGIAGKVYGSYSATAPKGRMANNLNLGEVNPVSNKGHVVVCSSTNTTLIRNYAKQTDLVVGDVSYNALSDEQLKSKNCLLELTANAGYENKLGSSVQALSWQAGENGYPELGSEVAAITYRVEVLPSLLGEPDWNTLASEDVRAAYFEPGTQVILPVRAYKGYTFEGFQVEGVLQAGNTFTMPAKDIQLNLVFHSGNATDWASMAQYAEAGTDYSFEGFTYEVHTAKGLAYLALQVNEGKVTAETVIRLTADIDLNVNNAAGELLRWIPIGNDTNPFVGIFDGASFTIDHMNVKETDAYAGLFGKTSGAEIVNVSIGKNSRIFSKGQYLGSIVGQAVNTVITNCRNAADVVSENNYVGGIAGDVVGEASVVSLCANTGNVRTTKNMAGGIVARLGDNSGASSLFNCYNTGTVSAKLTAGGLVGMLQTPTKQGETVNRSTVANSYNTGNVTVDSNMAGGIAAFINMYGEVKNCVSCAAIVKAGGKYAGGVVGSNINKNNPGLITRSYYLTNTAQAGSDLNEMGTALTSEQMYSSNLATEMSNFAGFLNSRELTSYLQWTKTSSSCPTFGKKNTIASAAYILTIAESLHGKYELIKPAAVLAVDSTTLFVRKNTQVTFKTLADSSYVFYALRVNGELQTEYVNNFRTGASDTRVEVLFSLPRRWDFLATEAIVGTDYTETEAGYEVHTPLGLAYIADQVNNQKNQLNGKLVTLTDDINLAKKNADGDDFDWAPIGVMGTPFKGNFDGRGHRVLNMLVRAASGYGGLFGTVSADTLANVTLAGYSAVAGSNYVGALAGYMDSKAMVVNCNNDSCIVKGTNYVGGLIGSAGSGCRILNSSSSGEVCGKDKVGGIVGYLQGEVEACLSSGKVKSEAKGGAILGDGYKPKAMRCYFQEGLVNAGESGETVTGTALSESDIVSENLAKELTAYAGYTNRTVDGCAWGEWRQKADGTVFSSSEKAKDAYAAFVTETAHGAVRLPVVLSRDEEAAFYAIAGQFVPLEINPEEGYKLDCLTLNDEAIELSDGCFVMPDCEAVITATFAEQPTSILSEVQDGIRIWTSGEMLMVVSDTTVPMTVFEMDGRVSVAEKAVSGSVAYRLQPGAYIVQVGTSTYKILINSL